MQNVVLKILFLDIPSLIDSTWRRIDHGANAERVYVGNRDSARLDPRPFWKKPPFWFFTVLVLFVSLGPTWTSLCRAASEPVIMSARWLLALAIAGVSLAFAWRHRLRPWSLVERRFGRVAPGDHVSTERRVIVTILAYVGPLMVLVVCLGGAYTLAFTSQLCIGKGFDSRSLISLVLCLGVIVAFGVLASRPSSTPGLVCIQVAAIVLLALVHWFFLSDSSVREADYLPYRHVFAFWAPAIVAILLLAPLIARAMLPTPHPLPVTSETRSDPDNLDVEAVSFADWLKRTELFENRGEPVLSGRRLFFALIYGPFYHLLHLLLLPALVALVVDAKWLYVSVSVVFVFSVLLLMWGNVAARWDEMNVQIERWFLQGGPLFVSVLVIVLAVLRVLQFDYISTILDAVPFGTIFGMILMTYVLFWLVEYWLNRIVAARLLRVLGDGPDELTAYYSRCGPAPSEIRVLRQGRFIVSHGTGRFVAVGTPSAGREPVAFNSFNLTGLFARVAEQAPTQQERGYAMDIQRRTGNYFFSLNALMLAVTAAFIGYYAVKHYSNNGIEPVIATRVSPQAGGPADLADLLVEKPGQTGPAVVVVGSGGGTRAALYTASVLRGLHRIGADRDIVLLSGVSGGGVALAYFAAYRDALVTAPRDGGGSCPDDFAANTLKADLWDCFDDSMTRPFIEDVLNGATEWRVFSRTALSALLAESFEHRLFGNRRLASIESPALILNVSVVSHPAEASDLLQRTLDAAPTAGAQDEKCGEAERAFQMLSGGRIIFTNLRDSGKFPQRDPRIPDIRLPYHVMQADDIPLATAAALNANFPPIFPSARVRIADAVSGDCPARTYYVTDGGAVENLGLISALYALQSAVDRVPMGSRLRPIHVVLAEASAVTYDYGQDRGLSALGGSRERLAGGLTETLIRALEDQITARDQASPKIEFYYLGLPLAFRARGGFGTHWMYAKEYHLSDPRQRSIPLKNYIPLAVLRNEKAAVDRKALQELWLALHDPDRRFCDGSRKFESADSIKVQSWICGDSKANPEGRDLHMEQWQRLVERIRR
jgi:hypothetical protein